MRTVVSIVIGAVTAVFVAATMMLNFDFGVGFGRSDVERHVFGVVAVGFDLLKAVLPVVIWSAFARRRLGIGLLGSVLWLGCLAISLASAIGVSGSVRAVEAEAKEQQRQTLESRKRDLERQETRRQEIGAVESAAVIERRLAELRALPAWRWSRECADARDKEQREACREVRRAERQREEAREAAELDRTIAELQATLRTADTGRSGGQMQVDMLAGFLTLPRALVEDGLSLGWVAVVELVACFGFLLAATHAEPSPDVSRPVATGGDVPRPVESCDRTEGRVLEFAATRLAPAAGAQLPIDGAYAAYAAWCCGQGTIATERDAFMAILARTARDVECWRIDGQRLLGVKVI